MNIFDIEVLISILDREDLQEELGDRLAIITHKIKFIEKSEVFLTDETFQFNAQFLKILQDAGGVQAPEFSQAAKVVALSTSFSMTDWFKLLGEQPLKNWNAYQANQIYIIDTQKYDFEQVKDLIQLVEDLAEILYPGLFIFGGEGLRWLQFKTL